MIEYKNSKLLDNLSNEKRIETDEIKEIETKVGKPKNARKNN